MPGVVGVEFVDLHGLGVALGEVFVVVEGAVVGGDAVEVAEVFGLGAFFPGQESFVHLLAVSDADNLDVLFLASEELTDGLGLGLDGAGGGFLDEDVAVLAVFEGEEDEVHGFVEAHDETGHRGLGDGDGLAGADLVDPQGDHAPPAAHHVAVAGAADASFVAVAALGHGDFFFQGFADAHGVDGVCGLVGGEADDTFDTRIDGDFQDVVRADDVSLDGFHWEEFATGDLFEGGGVEDVIYAAHGAFEGRFVADVTDVEFDFVGYVWIGSLVFVAHVVLLLLVAGEDANLFDVGAEESLQHGIAERSGPAGNHKSLIFENGHIV